MAEVANIRLDTRRLDEIAKHLNTGADNALASLSFQIEGVAKTLSPIDTGALRNSIKAEKMGKLLWWVHDEVDYGIYQELGTYRMAAHPFMVPAVERVRKQIAQMVGEEVFK